MRYTAEGEVEALVLALEEAEMKEAALEVEVESTRRVGRGGGVLLMVGDKEDYGGELAGGEQAGDSP